MRFFFRNYANYALRAELCNFASAHNSEGAESSKSCNLIGSESRQFFTILPANPGGIVGSFIHKKKY